MRNIKAGMLFLCLITGICSVVAQTKIDKLSVKYGPSLPDDKQALVKIIGEANGKIFGLAMQKKDYYMQVFDAVTMKQLSSNIIELPELSGKELEFQQIYLLNGKLFAIGSVYTGSDKTYNLVARAISEKGVLDKKPIMLFESEVAKKSEKGNFYFKESLDNKTLLVMHTSKFPKEDAVKYEVKLFDENMGVLFKGEEKVPFDDSKKDYEFTVADFEMDQNQDIFIVIDESYRDSKAKNHREKFELHSYKKSNNYKKEILKMDIKDKEVINCSMMSTSKNTLKLVGFYSGVRDNGKALKELRGIFNITVDINQNVTTDTKFNEFTMKTKSLILGERRAQKGKEIKPLYAITDIIEKENGGLIVLSEYQTVYVGKSSGIGPLAMTPVTYTKNEIIVTSLNPDGTHEWSNVLPKEQSSTVTTLSFNMAMTGTNGSFYVGAAMSIPFAHLGNGPEYLGAIPICMNGHLYMVFNDNVKNKGITAIDDIKAFTNPKNCCLTLFDFNERGAITRKDPDDELKNGLVLRPGVYWRKSDSELVVYSSRSSQEHLGRMTMAN